MTTLVFGVFDYFHPGHRYFLEQAALQCPSNKLIVILARDEIVVKYKKRAPYHSNNVRLTMVRQVPCVTEAYLGDGVEDIGKYTHIYKYKPSLICVGHDQTDLANDLKQRLERGEFDPFEIRVIPPYCRELYSTTRLRPDRGPTLQ